MIRSMSIQPMGCLNNRVARVFGKGRRLASPVNGLFWLALLGLSLNAPGLAAAAAGGADAKETGRDRAHYSADDPVNFQHMRLQLVFTPEGLMARTCEGRVEYTLEPRAKEIETVQLDAVDMRILAVELPGQEKPPTFSYDDKVLTIQLPKPLKLDETLRLAVKYR